MVEVIAGRGFVTLKHQLRREDVHRSTNISIIQVERDVFTKSIGSRMGMGDIAGVQGWCCGFFEDPFDCCHDLRVSVTNSQRRLMTKFPELAPRFSSSSKQHPTANAKRACQTSSSTSCLWPAINRVRQYWRGYIFS